MSNIKTAGFTRVQANQITIELNNGSTVKPLSFLPDTRFIVRGDKPHSTTPVYDEAYVYDEPLWHELIGTLAARQFLDTRPGVMSVGLPGTGKSKAWRQMAAILNRPFYEATGRDDMDLLEVTGRFLPAASENGGTNMTYLSGPLLNALKLPHAIFLFEEYDRCRPEVTVNFNSLLDGYGLSVNETAQHFPVPEGFVFVASANGNGQGDQSGLCSTSQVIDYSNMDRFQIIEHEYMPDDLQLSMLQAYCNIGGKQQLPDAALKVMIKFGGLCRDAFQNQGASIPAPFTLRTLIDFVTQILAFGSGSPRGDRQKWQYWLDRAYISKMASKHAPETDGIRQAVYELAETSGLDQVLAG